MILILNTNDALQVIIKSCQGMPYLVVYQCCNEQMKYIMIIIITVA